MSIKGNAESYIKLRGSLSMPKAIYGKSAYEIALAHGFKGTEEEWLASLKGATDGKSAYEIALSHGFKGTEEEWLASLEGKDGKDGIDGIPSGYTPEIWTFTLADGTVVTTKVLTKDAYASFTITGTNTYGETVNYSETVTSGTTWGEWCAVENAEATAAGCPFDLWTSEGRSGVGVFNNGSDYYVCDSNGNRVLWDSEIIAGEYSLG